MDKNKELLEKYKKLFDKTIEWDSRLDLDNLRKINKYIKIKYARLQND